MDCPNCNKKLGNFKVGSIYKLGDKRFCSIKCKKEYKNKHTKTNEMGDIQSKVFWWSFIIVGFFFIILAIPSGFGSFLGFVIVIIVSLIIAFFIALGYGAARRGKQIGDIIEARHQEINK